MTSTSNSSSSVTASTALVEVSDENNSADVSISSTGKSAIMLGDKNSNDTPPVDSSNKNNIELEYDEIGLNRNGWGRLYEQIRLKCEIEAGQKRFLTTESEKQKNRSLNRYRDVNPYDHSRIIIHRGDVDYINANLVKLERADRKYILTQGPLADTVAHFWLMVWEQETKAILMLNKLIEKNQVKCHMYWPERKGPENVLKLNEVKLSIEFLRCEEYKNFCVRWFILTDLESNQSREIIQFHYTTWPDFGIPSSPVAFLQFLKQVRDSGALNPDVGPAVVHCSAGIGRSGTFCLVDCCLFLVDKEGVENVSIQDVLYELRTYRMGLIQTSDQLYFSYKAIIEGIKLLKDPKFIDNTELPTVSSDDSQHHEETIVDETPPPLPPRSHSLLPLAGNGGVGNSQKDVNPPEYDICLEEVTKNEGLPLCTPSEEEDDDSWGRMIDVGTLLSSRLTKRPNRPLPPPPPPKPFRHRQYVGDSSSESEGERYCFFPSIKRKGFPDYETMRKMDIELSNYYKEQNRRNAHNEEDDDDDDDDSLQSNGIDKESKESASSETEMRRRKRAERQACIKQKVNDIKRKQRKNDDNQKTAKKRRSLITYITAGVVVGVICVYAYSKLT